MQLIAEYTGRDQAVMQLYRSEQGWHVSETGAGWDQEHIGTNARSQVEALEYVQDIANHAPQCYQLSFLLGEKEGVGSCKRSLFYDSDERIKKV